MKLYNDVYQLLSENDCVIIPNFGGFVANYSEAKVDLRTQEFCPPEKKLAFNESLRNNDGLLMKHICNSQNVSWDIANDYVLQFVSEINESLKNNQTLSFEKLGQFTRKSGTLVFTPYLGNNLLESSFGLSSFHFPLLKPEKSFIEIQKPKQLSKTKSAKANKSAKPRRTVLYVLASAAVLTGLVTLSFHFGLFDNATKDKDFANIAPVEVLINTDSSSKNVENSTANETENIKETSNIDTVNTDVVELVNADINIEVESNLSSHIIAGSFSNTENAQALKNKLSEAGFSSQVIPGPNGMVRVTVKSFATSSEANAALTDLRTQTGNQSLWVLNL